MNEEWYEYATSIKKRANNKLKKTSDAVTCSVLAFLSLILLKYNVWYWLILAISYCLALLYNSKEKDDYAKVLFDIGITLVVVGVESASMLALASINAPLVICTIIGFVLYEILVLIKIKRRTYSRTNATKLKKGGWAAASSVLITYMLGSFLKSNEGLPLLFFLLSLVSAMFFIFAITFLQRYVVYKIMNNRYASKN